MTTVILIDNKRVEVPTVEIRKSNLFNSLIDYSGKDNIVTFPQQYISVSHIYINYVNNSKELDEIILTRDELKCSFILCHFIDHDGFFDFLMQCLFDCWSKYNSMVSELSDNLQHEIYLHCPYTLVPESQRGYYDLISRQYKLNKPFLVAWLKINRIRFMVVNKEDIYDVGTSYHKYANGNISPIGFVSLHRKVHELPMLALPTKLGIEISWTFPPSSSSTLCILSSSLTPASTSSRSTYSRSSLPSPTCLPLSPDDIIMTDDDELQINRVIHNSVDGYDRYWLLPPLSPSNAMPILSEETYHNSDYSSVCTRKFYLDGSTIPESEKLYHNDSKHGMWKFWYPKTGNVKLVAKFNKDEEHGTCYEYYDTEDQQVKYEYTFNNGNCCGTIKHYYEQQQKQQKQQLMYQLVLGGYKGTTLTQWSVTGQQTYSGIIDCQESIKIILEAHNTHYKLI